MGSDTDLPVMQEAVITLEELGIGFELAIISAHRTPEELARYAKEAAARDIGVIIAGASGAAHLAGIIAAYTLVPVIGVPLAGGSLGGLDALLATAQMPRGIPVATMAINGARNAALFAAQIFALQEPGISTKLSQYREKMAAEAKAKHEKLRLLGPKKYPALDEPS